MTLPERLAHLPDQDVITAGDVRKGYVASDAGFARRPPEERLDPGKIVHRSTLAGSELAEGHRHRAH